MTQLCIVGPVSAKWINDGSDIPQAVIQVGLTEVWVQAGKKGEPTAQPYSRFNYTIQEDDRFDKSFWEHREGRAVVVMATPYDEDTRKEEPTLGTHSVQSVLDITTAR